MPIWKTAAAPCVLLVAALAVGCAGVQFDRDPQAHRYKPLKYGTKATLGGASAELPPPVEVLGTFTLTTRKGEAEDRPQAEATFLQAAPGKGCDLITDVAVEPQEKRSKKTVRRLGKDGRQESVQEEVVTTVWQWTARCVRTAKAGLAEPGSAVAATGENSGQGGAVDLTGPDGADVDTRPGPDTPTARASREMAGQLLRHGGAWLQAWRDRLVTPQPEAMDVLEAFNELAYQVTGPGGFWRKTVPRDWFGCLDDPSSAQCVQLAKASEEFKAWDQIQSAIAGLPRNQAASWLRRNQKRLTGYLDTYVPAEASYTGMSSTTFYKAWFK